MGKARRQSAPRTKAERALDEIYKEIPNIPACTGECADACGPIAMFRGEWERIKRRTGRTPRLKGIACPMLSPTGKCTVYTVRPFICRLWGATKTLQCPKGCEPERWLTTEEAKAIFERIRAVAGPEVTGPLGNIDDLWGGFALEERASRAALIERIEQVVNENA